MFHDSVTHLIFSNYFFSSADHFSSFFFLFERKEGGEKARGKRGFKFSHCVIVGLLVYFRLLNKKIFLRISIIFLRIRMIKLKIWISLKLLGVLLCFFSLKMFSCSKVFFWETRWAIRSWFEVFSGNLARHLSFQWQLFD